VKRGLKLISTRASPSLECIVYKGSHKHAVSPAIKEVNLHRNISHCFYHPTPAQRIYSSSGDSRQRVGPNLNLRSTQEDDGNSFGEDQNLSKLCHQKPACCTVYAYVVILTSSLISRPIINANYSDQNNIGFEIEAHSQRRR